jgi:U3 small nucleolar RNA-associated protein 25
MKALNQIPKHKDMTSDINEMKEHWFEGLGKFYRQNIVHTEYKFPELNSIANRYFENFEGCLSNRPCYSRLITEAEVEINQEFSKFDVDDYSKEPELRFEFFKSKVSTHCKI